MIAVCAMCGLDDPLLLVMHPDYPAGVFVCADQDGCYQDVLRATVDQLWD